MNRARMHRALAIAVCVVAIVASPGIALGQEASPQAADLPEVAAPFGLDEVTLPATEGEMREFFAGLPQEVAGETAQPMHDLEDRIIASWGTRDAMYGPPMTLQVLSFRDGDFFPVDFTAGEFVAMSMQTEDTEATGGGRDGDLVWVQTETTVGFAGDNPGTPEASMTMYTLSWGLADGGWLFLAMATTPEGLDAVVTAFVETASAR
jgi:hypothetical protein